MKQEAIKTLILPGDKIKAVFKGSEIPVDLQVRFIDKDKVVLSPNGRKTFVVAPEVLINGGEADRLKFEPFDSQPELTEE